MRIPSHLLLRWLGPASLLLGMGAEARAQEAHDHMNMAMPAQAASPAGTVSPPYVLNDVLQRRGRFAKRLHG